MVEGAIPMNAGDLPIESVLCDDSLVYTVEFVKAQISPKPDKNGNLFIGAQYRITDGDFEGVTLMKNYTPIPPPLRENASKGERIKWQNLVADFGRMSRCFKFTGHVPPVSATDPQSREDFMNWISGFYGNQGQVTVENSEFPANSGKMRSGIKDFVL